MSVIKPKSQQTEGPGNSIGTRREFVRTNHGSAPSIQPAKHQPLDKFLGSGKRPGNLSEFAPDANFKNSRIRYSGEGAPLKRPQHDYVEKGLAQRMKSDTQRPSDNAILNFLNRVIDMPNNAPKAQRFAGKPAIPSRPVQGSRPIQPAKPQTATASAKPSNQLVRSRVAPNAAQVRK